MGLVENDESGGRMITKEGQRELDTVAVQAAAEEEEEDELIAAHCPAGWDCKGRGTEKMDCERHKDSHAIVFLYIQ